MSTDPCSACGGALYVPSWDPEQVPHHVRSGRVACGGPAPRTVAYDASGNFDTWTGLAGR